jgi:hypothetical protein
MVEEINTTEPVVNPVQIVTIKNKVPLFKGEEQANAIEKIELEENGFSLVSQKDLYQIGDKAVYIQPDYSLSDIPLFDSFIRPFGEVKKSKLGSNFRIRAVKFNLHTGDNEPTFSVGILLPLKEVCELVPEFMSKGKSFAEALGITKWEEPDNSGGIKTNGGRDFPSTIYKTDETNINNLWGHLENKVGYPLELVGTEKTDGSSISIIIKHGEFTVGSRKLIKPWKINKVVGRRKPNLLERFMSLFGYKPDLLIKELVDNEDEFLTITKPYIDRIKEHYGQEIINVSMILRGEGNGQSWKGSGNKNNPSSKNTANIKFFGVDSYEGVAVKMNEEYFNSLMEELKFERCKVVFRKVFNSKEEIQKECNDYFKTNLIEGIVLRTMDSNFSAKLMNDEYDSKK